MNDTVDVAVVGAGPYGLSLAAHLRAAGVRYRQFGLPMNQWQSAMPRGMYLKSQGFASNLSDPQGTHTLKAFCRETGQIYADYGEPVPLETFIAYGRWFQEHQAPGVEELLVTDVARDGRDYELTLQDGERVHAHRVVIAAGVEHFPRVPRAFTTVPAHLVSHSAEHTELGAFAGRDVVVIGAGQSALETAALLHEGSAKVQLIARRSRISWNGLPLLPDRPLYRRIREPEAGLGSGLSTWFYSTQPGLFRRLPASTRAFRARTALGPAGAWWLRDRVEGRFPIHLGQRLDWAQAEGDRVRIGLWGEGRAHDLTADHVVCATGYPPDLARFSFLDANLRAQLRTLDRTPQVGWDYQSSVPGLFFIGPAVAPTFGPVMRFVYGADHAVRQVTQSLRASAGRRAGAIAGVSR
jgi:cation diffusion facilitator CzcD-associated flavoprotein CzcO